MAVRGGFGNANYGRGESRPWWPLTKGGRLASWAAFHITVNAVMAGVSYTTDMGDQFKRRNTNRRVSG